MGREGLSRRKLGMKMLHVENNMGEFKYNCRIFDSYKLNKSNIYIKINYVISDLGIKYRY